MKTIARKIIGAALAALVLILIAGCRAKGAAECRPAGRNPGHRSRGPRCP